jgi:hypothetical protein
MIETEYKRLTNHIITFFTKILERSVIDGKREDKTKLVDTLDIITQDRYNRKSNLHNEPISMLDALCGIIAKINKRKNNDLTTRQIDMFNRIVRDLSKARYGNEDEYNDWIVNMVSVDDSTQNSTFGNGLFDIQ